MIKEAMSIYLGEYRNALVRIRKPLLWLTVSYSRRSDKMPAAVIESFMQVFKKEGEMDDEQAKKYFNTMEKNRRFQQECWS